MTSEANDIQALTENLSSDAIKNVLSAPGPAVKCVVLRHINKKGRDVKPHPASPNNDGTHKREVLTELIDEVVVDITPTKSEIKKLLGGTITFLGQYPDEGTVIVIRAELPDNLDCLSVSMLRDLCDSRNVNTSSMVEKRELVDALEETRLPVNPHQLQPPFDGVVVHGDIVLIRVAETEEELDYNEKEEDRNNESINVKKEFSVLSNEEFFLDYTKDEYIAFASRTDIVAPDIPEDDSDEEDEEIDESEDGENDDDDEEDGPGWDEEEDRRALLNLLLGEVLKKFREDNGRGPDSRELLELRSQVAAKLGVEVASLEDMDQIDEESERSNKRRDNEGGSNNGSSKKVKFTPDTTLDKETIEPGCISNDEPKGKEEDDKKVNGGDFGDDNS